MIVAGAEAGLAFFGRSSHFDPLWDRGGIASLGSKMGAGFLATRHQREPVRLLASGATAGTALRKLQNRLHQFNSGRGLQQKQ